MYNPFDFDSCIRYIDDNNISFNNAQDILEKQDLDFFDDDEDVREIALKNAKVLIEHYQYKYWDEISNSYRNVDNYEIEQILGNYFDYKEMYEQEMYKRMMQRHGRN